MEILTPRVVRRSTRVRVEIPVTVTSMDRRHQFSATCDALVVSAQGCGLRTSQALPLETPILLSDLPGGASASARVASCLPLGHDGKQFLIGMALYNPGNIWGIANPPQDWHCDSNAAVSLGNRTSRSGNVWPYNIFSAHGEARPGRK
ncbi:MAG: hypothetical protein WAN65_16510 [Candidatus Sulfotelmatobacter sp.]